MPDVVVCVLQPNVFEQKVGTTPGDGNEILVGWMARHVEGFC